MTAPLHQQCRAIHELAAAKVVQACDHSHSRDQRCVLYDHANNPILMHTYCRGSEVLEERMRQDQDRAMALEWAAEP